ncbi:MAG: RsmE family RNA methyltransferase, partial [Actinobacteria bacterium]|nr:RsmE family RNA methyltransferase [Actinomycetota bacterium]
EEDDLRLSVMQWRHLTKVLRLNRGDSLSYTDGLGRTGRGRLGNQGVMRDEETRASRPTELTVAVAPPANKDRQRYLVEKLAELGVARLQWLSTRHGEGRVASGPKLFAWVTTATEQSRGAWLMETSPVMTTWDDLEPPLVVCDPGGEAATPLAATVAIGPEGGWSPEEIPNGLPRWSLGSNVLRVETAAVVATARILAR